MPASKAQLKSPAFASLSLAFASFGDAFLYPFLSVNYAVVGLPVVWVGLVLSVNRFVRIFSNAWTVHLISRYGLRPITITAVMVAMVSTAGYAFASSILLWLLLRVLWGLAFSALRISTLAYSLQQSQQGFALGFTRGIQETGPMLALFFAPLLLHYLTITKTFYVITLLSVPALYFAWKLPNQYDKTPTASGKSILALPSLLNSITFTTSFLIDGVMVVVLGALFLHYNIHMTLLIATSLVAIYLGYRRVCLVLFSPIGGWAADRFGLKRVFNTSLLMVIIGLLLLVSGIVEIGIIITFTSYSVYTAITPGLVSQGKEHPLACVAANATWRDVGAACGTLVGGLVLSSTYLHYPLIIALVSLVMLFLFHMGTDHRKFKFIYLWK